MSDGALPCHWSSTPGQQVFELANSFIPDWSSCQVVDGEGEEEVPIKPACLLKQVSAGGETAVCLKKMYPALQFINLSSVMEQYGGKVWWKIVKMSNCQNVKLSNSRH